MGHDGTGVQGFWRMLSYGTTLLIRLVNVHVLIGAPCLVYGVRCGGFLDFVLGQS